MRLAHLAMAPSVLALAATPLLAQALVDDIQIPTYDNPAARAEGPYERLVIRNATLIDGTGAPPRGPYDIVIEGDRIARVVSVGLQGLDDPAARRPPAGDRELDAAGMTITPGFINTHGHLGPYSVPTYNMAYIYKLWLAHGVTTTRIVGSLRGLDWTVEQGRRAAAGEIEAPDIQAYAIVGLDIPPVRSPDEMRAPRAKSAAVMGRRLSG